ncbi:MAG: UbiA family prenyltransferase [Candidatus Diapherotrites archaeon]|jgi:4-hydroxybenzoate polyprenyltransferase|nr:UbiA family prenyltransferase [Candidatus Diapherotrites archaeon]MBT4596532.1 UbiA family prenyltransferase [Candidatus Diapherotrites archaeon]
MPTTKTKKKSKQAKTTTKKYPCFQKFLGLIELGRPIEWSKSLLNMVLAALMVFYIYNIGLDLFVFIAGFLSVAFLWSSQYALNDYTDWKIDLIHATKKKRPIPSGKVTPKQGLVFSIVLLIASFAIAFALQNGLLVICLLAMLTNQLFYTTKPWRLKSRKGFDIISGSMVNPFFRYFSGIVLFVPGTILLTQGTPILPILFVVGIQFSGYTLYRLFSKGHDKKVKMKSTVAMLPEKRVKQVAYIVMLIAGLSYIGLILNGTFFRITWLGYLPVQFFGAIAIVLLFSPLLKDAIKKPQNAKLDTSYRTLYIMNIAFVLGNVIIFLLFP